MLPAVNGAACAPSDGSIAVWSTCTFCFERSFASYKGVTLNGKKKVDCIVNQADLRLPLSSNKKVEFECDVCLHVFSPILAMLPALNGVTCAPVNGSIAVSRPAHFVSTVPLHRTKVDFKRQEESRLHCQSIGSSFTNGQCTKKLNSNAMSVCMYFQCGCTCYHGGIGAPHAKIKPNSWF